MDDVAAYTEKRDPLDTGAVQEHIGLSTKAIYGVGDIANAVKIAALSLFTLFFYTTVLGLPGVLVGVASTIGLAWDAVVDPYIGHISDRTRFRYGRRHPYMFLGAITMGVCLWAFFSPPRQLSTAGLFVWLLVTSLLVRTTTSLYSVPYFALGAELSKDYNERTSITATRSFLGLLGTVAAASLSFIVFFPDRNPGVDPKLDVAGYPAMGLAFGCIMTVTALIATLGTLKKQQDVPENSGEATLVTPRRFFADSMQALRNPSFRVMFVSFSLFFLGIVVTMALSIHFVTYYAGITSSEALSSFQAAFYIGGMIGVVIWLLVSRRIEKHVLYILAGLSLALLLVGAVLLVGQGNPLGTGNRQAIFVGHAIAGLLGSVVWIMPWSMMADIADEDELRTGRRREGTLTGIFFLGQQLASAFAVLLAGGLIDWYAGLIPGQASQPVIVVQRIGMLYGLLPAAILCLAAVIALRYPLNKAQVVKVQHQLALQRASRTKGFEQET